MFHGAGDTGPGFQAWTGLDAAADEAGFISVWPNGTPTRSCFDDIPPEECVPEPPYFWLPEDIGYVRELIAHLEDGLVVDSRRIFAAGMSMGSLFTHQLACGLSDRLAAVAPVASTVRPADAFACNPSSPLPIVMTLGTEDGQFPWDGSGGHLSKSEMVALWTELDGCTGDPVIEWLPDVADDGTRVWTESYRNCNRGAEVVFYGIEGGGHTWPGALFPPPFGLTSQDISTSAEIIAFFSRHPLGG